MSSHFAVSPLIQSTDAASSTRLSSAVILPAYNEAGRITDVLKTIAQSSLIDEIIVVTDGCDDTTADEARGFAARLARGEVLNSNREPIQTSMRVFELDRNIGKGGAMTYGALRTEADVLLFLDADLIGLRPSHVDALLAPAVSGDASTRCDMVMGLFGAARGGPLGWWLSWCHRRYAELTGQRSIRREVFLAVPDLTKSRYGVETAITRYVYSWHLRVSHTMIDNVTHPLKEEKAGLWRGLARRFSMLYQIYTTAFLFTLRSNASSQSREETIQMRQRFSERL